jgi:hypothetical protein
LLSIKRPWTTNPGQRSPSHLLSIFVLPWLTFAFCIITPFFLGRSNGVAAGSDGYVVRLGIGLQVYEKQGETLDIIFRCTPIPLYIL